MRWKRLFIDLNQTIDVFQGHSAKTFHETDDGKIRVEAKLGGDNVMVLLAPTDNEEKEKWVKRLQAEGFLKSQIIIEPDL